MKKTNCYTFRFCIKCDAHINYAQYLNSKLPDDRVLASIQRSENTW